MGASRGRLAAALLLLGGLPSTSVVDAAEASKGASSSLRGTPASPEAGHPWTCNIEGFEEFCRHWNACQTAPLASTINRQKGRCLYGRAMPYDGKGDLAVRGLAGPWQRASMLQGGDALALLAGAHCAAKGRGRALIRLGWTRPDLGSMYGYVVFSLPCAAHAMADGYLNTVVSTSSWAPSSPPILATWEGVENVVLITDNNTASREVWDEVARHYSWSQGGLGFPGIARYGTSFLQVCRAGGYRGGSAGCCREGLAVAPYQALQRAFGQPGAQESSANQRYHDPAILRAYLNNALALNPFYEGTGRTFDGCEGQYQISASSEYFFPNKHTGNWRDANDMVTVGEVISNRAGFYFIWGPGSSCSRSSSPCQYSDGTSLPDCPLMNATIVPALLPLIVGGKVDPPCILPDSAEKPDDSGMGRPVDGAPGGSHI